MTAYRINPDLTDKTLRQAGRHAERLLSAAQQIAARSDGSGLSGDPVVVRAVAGFYVLHERRVRDLAAQANKAIDGADQAIRAYDEADEKMAADQRRFGSGAV
ncbi:hypothetical protein C8K30_10125 [Promicromonospora sp. AC04]|uniref:DUF6507 family protein n=1 Tax=Promicromonospora sp. AC04 TaxID=2135723 RepID=UPI000D378BE8|nr:DUF6507 family protein [Promicromonospora sp. AC04]PUB31512.1 hypothetical protein C8K30_10125 [Promicromonospora sp. AC04]